MKVYSPAVMDAVCDCLRTCHWFKKELRSFLNRAGVPVNVVANLPWDAHKRDIARTLVDFLAQHPQGGTGIMTRLLDALVEMNEDFPHLRKLEDGAARAEEARQALRYLKSMFARETTVEMAQRARQERRTEAERSAAELAKRQSAMAMAKCRFAELSKMEDPQKRGLMFQDLLRTLFALHDLEPRGAFSIPGEQTDGSISIDGVVMLVEAKWTAVQTSPGELREFRTKVHDKLDNTLGLFISANGFSEQAIESASAGRLLVVLVDGQDLSLVLEGMVDLTEMLRRKLRLAAETGRALSRVT